MSMTVYHVHASPNFGAPEKPLPIGYYKTKKLANIAAAIVREAYKNELTGGIRVWSVFRRVKIEKTPSGIEIKNGIPEWQVNILKESLDQIERQRLTTQIYFVQKPV